MSSHHIVREKQEPALLVLGLENFSDELLGQLLEWSPTVIATVETADDLSSREIKIDWIITSDSTEVSQPHVKLIPVSEGNTIVTALKFLAENGYASVNIITDDLRLNDYEPFINRINLVIFNCYQKIYAVSSGYSKWKSADEGIRLLINGNNLITEGLYQTSDKEYKTTYDGFFTLQFDDPFLFVAEDI
ncbi:MAG TPA: thiamine diphosphokinase [Mucilaginibacter sp.]|jgi:thiamine pyrophosphokinase|nr:thiamine diphosphokinase [Mucilaginibacter sp.]